MGFIPERRFARQLSSLRRRLPRVERLEPREVLATIPYGVPAGTVGNLNYGAALGMDFDVQQAMVVTHLGVFDSGSNGMFLPIQARIYNRDTQTLLGAIRFDYGATGTLLGGSRYLPLDVPLILPPGFQGTIVADPYGNAEPAGDELYGPLFMTADTGNGALTFVGSRSGGTGTFPTTVDQQAGPPNRYAAGAFLFVNIQNPTVFYNPSWAGLPGKTIVDTDLGTSGIQPGVIGFDAFAEPPDQHGVVYVDDDWANLSQGTVVDTDPATEGIQSAIIGGDAFATLQAGINQVLPGGIVYAAAGTYPESLTITKPLSLAGAQRGQLAGPRADAFVNGKANPALETILTAPANLPTDAAGDLVHFLSDGITLDGLVLDGNNPVLGGSSVTSAGLALHARHGVSNSAADGTRVVGNGAGVVHSIVQNVAGSAIDFRNAGGANTVAEVRDNVLRRFGAGIPDTAGVLLSDNAFANITQNRIDDRVGRTGILFRDATGTRDVTWLSNDITVGQDGIGISVLRIAGSGPDAIEVGIVSNTLRAAPGVDPGNNQTGLTWGVSIASVSAGSTVQMVGNTIGTSGGSSFTRGVNLWNLPTFNSVRVAGGSIGYTLVGLELDSIHPVYGAGLSTMARVTDVTIAAGDIGIRVRADALPNPPSQGSNVPIGNVELRLVGGRIFGAVEGIRVDAPDPWTNGCTAMLRLDADFNTYLPGPRVTYNLRGVVLSGGSAYSKVADAGVTNNSIGLAAYGGHLLVQYSDLRNNTTSGVDAAYGGCVDLGGGSHSGLGFGLGGNDFSQGYTASGAKAIRNFNTRSTPGFGLSSFPTDITALDNGFGPVGYGIVEGCIYHNYDDTTLGCVLYNNVSASVPQPRVESVTPYAISATADGATGQRSMIRQLQVVVDSPVFLSPGALTLARTAPSSLTWYTGVLPIGSFTPRVVSALINGTTGKTTICLDFVGAPTTYLEAIGGSLIDGRYTLTLDGTKAQACRPNSGVFTQSLSQNFFRLFGDGDGNGRVDSADVALCNSVRSNPAAPLFAAFDFNSSGGPTLDSTDRTQLMRRLNRGQIF